MLWTRQVGYQVRFSNAPPLEPQLGRNSLLKYNGTVTLVVLYIQDCGSNDEHPRATIPKAADGPGSC